MTEDHHPRAVSREAGAYGAALKSRFRRAAQAAEITQHQLAQAANVDPSAVTRYFQGALVAPKSFVEQFAKYLKDHEVGLTEEDLMALHEFRRAAQQVSRAHMNRIAHLQERVELLERQRAEAPQEDQQSQRDELDAVDRNLEMLAEELRQAGHRAATAEVERDELRERLGHAARYTRETKERMAREQAQLAAVEHEVKVLRQQVRRLHEPPPPPQPDRPHVAEPSTQASAAQKSEGSTTPPHSEPPSGGGFVPPLPPRREPRTAPVEDGPSFGILVVLGVGMLLGANGTTH
ncbi:helix-turn-helix domain-containing protein [Streptomyces mirabilis]|uniref:helix-turn-helix domain-containing protein n=1 Tax=Streptomyces mirabilis TaxID=68239 RepID=UPI00371CFD0C